jgi:Flp pilus assembly protein TadD
MAQVNASQALALAVRLQAAGRAREAEDLCRRLLAAEPDNAAVLLLLGGILARGHPAEAEAPLRKVISLDPDSAEAHCCLGDVLQAAGRRDEAVASYRRAMELAPRSALAFGHLGILMQRAGHAAEAITLLQQAVDIEPRNVAFLAILGHTLTQAGRLDEAIAVLTRVVHLDPDHQPAHFDLGNAQRRHGDLAAAAISLRHAVALKPDGVEALVNLAVVQRALGDVAAAEAALRRAIAIRPDYVPAHFNLSQILLLQGRFAEGWREAEWRLRAPPAAAAHQIRRRVDFDKPQWHGEDMSGRTILLHAEQGLGDMLQFARFVPLVAKRAAHVIVEVHAPLVRLLAQLPGAAAVVAHGDPLPPFDVHLPLMSLPAVLGIDEHVTPAGGPYLHATPADVERWRTRLGAAPGLRSVGVVWAGSPTHQDDQARSLAAAALLPRLVGAHVRLVTLQKEPRPGDGEIVASLGGAVVDVGHSLTDFADTAALMMALDLVISVDSAVAHLAGALGRPVWTLVPFAPDWRWMVDRSDSPWYPTMRLYRQTKRDDWASVLARLAADVAAWAAPK